MVIELSVPEYKALNKLAAKQKRTPRAQAEWMLMELLKHSSLSRQTQNKGFFPASPFCDEEGEECSEIRCQVCYALPCRCQDKDGFGKPSKYTGSCEEAIPVAGPTESFANGVRPPGGLSRAEWIKASVADGPSSVGEISSCE